jgi:hypothetical protein
MKRIFGPDNASMRSDAELSSPVMAAGPIEKAGLQAPLKT